MSGVTRWSARAVSLCLAITACGDSGDSGGNGGSAGAAPGGAPSDGGGGGCPVGSESCACTEGLGCDPGLACSDGICGPREPVCGDGLLDAGEDCDLGASLNQDTGICKSDCSAQACGDGSVGPNEACDDGDTEDGDTCTGDCRLPSCGDGIVQSGEECDDGDADDDDACTTLCRAPVCGDGLHQSDEECDLAAENNDLGDCTTACTLAACGDGHPQVTHGEQCDDGNAVDDDACTNDCHFNGSCPVGGNGCACTSGLGCDPGLSCSASNICQPTAGVCGDGQLGPDEECDLGPALNSNSGLCKVDCTVQICGDGFVGPNEACDDGDLNDGDECSNACELPSCGDGIVQGGEDCDDGDLDNDDTCTELCKAPACGDGFIQAGEDCDDGDGNVSTGACTPLCDLAQCGDGFVHVGVEACDDGNPVNTDGCTSTCALPSCGDGFVQVVNGEACDDGNSVSTDACTNACRSPFCGDGITSPSIGEQCDDADLDETDGCTSQCEIPGCGDGVLQGGEQCDDGNGENNDACTNQCKAPVCGDGFTYPVLEGCDDANFVTGDGCFGCVGIAQVVLGIQSFHACAILTNGTLKCWGENNSGQLGLGDTTRRGDSPNQLGVALPTINLGTGRKVLSVALGAVHTCAILDDHNVKCWGGNGNGRLGLGDTVARGDGPNEMGDALPIVKLGTNRFAVAIAAGYDHTCALLDNGSVKCWGDNAGGGLGLGDAQPRGNAANQMGDQLPAVPLGTGRTATAIAAMESATCALLDNATIKCWGYNGNGQLGQGDIVWRGDQPGELGDALLPVNLGPGVVPVGLTVGDLHACALLAGGSVKCWGASISGALGLGDLAQRGDQPGEMGANLPAVPLPGPATALAVSVLNTCARVGAGVLCWGDNASGQLGLGNTSHIGDQPGEVAALQPIDLGIGRTVVQIATGYSSACALLDNRTLKCWGQPPAIGSGGNARLGDGANEMGNNLIPLQLP